MYKLFKTFRNAPDRLVSKLISILYGLFFRQKRTEMQIERYGAKWFIFLFCHMVIGFFFISDDLNRKWPTRSAEGKVIPFLAKPSHLIINAYGLLSQ